MLLLAGSRLKAGELYHPWVRPTPAPGVCIRLRSVITQNARMAESDDSIRLTAWVHGRVQGVGFRWWTRARALQFGLVGSATNLPDGRVEVVAEGSRADCRRLLESLRGGATPGWVDAVVERWSPPKSDLHGFTER